MEELWAIGKVAIFCFTLNRLAAILLTVFYLPTESSDTLSAFILAKPWGHLKPLPSQHCTCLCVPSDSPLHGESTVPILPPSTWLRPVLSPRSSWSEDCLPTPYITQQRKTPPGMGRGPPLTPKQSLWVCERFLITQEYWCLRPEICKSEPHGIIYSSWYLVTPSAVRRLSGQLDGHNFSSDSRTSEHSYFKIFTSTNVNAVGCVPFCNPSIFTYLLP